MYSVLMPAATPQTKHYQLARQLREQLKTVKPGQELPTQREVMKQFNASQATVERAIRRLCDEGLVYRPSGRKRLVVQKHADPAVLRICLLRPDWPSNLFDAICRCIAVSGRERDWAFGYVSYRTMETINFRAITDSYDAVVFLMSGEAVPPDIARMLVKPPVPVILAQDFRDGLEASSVCNDDRLMARMSTRHLLELGHPNPIIAVPTLKSTGPILSAIEGWRQAYEAAGIHHLDFESLVIDSGTMPGEDSRYKTYHRWQELLKKQDPPSAVFCANSAVALGLLRALREAGLNVPDDVSVAAADAIADEAPFMSPPLTATVVDMSKFGEAVARLIEGQVSGEIEGQRQVWIDGDLVIRESTASYPSTAQSASSSTTHVSTGNSDANNF